MRDPKRIKPLLERIRKVWTKYPDLRLGQMVGNAYRGDPYFIEDEALVKAIEETHAQTTRRD